MLEVEFYTLKHEREQMLQLCFVAAAALVSMLFAQCVEADAKETGC